MEILGANGQPQTPGDLNSGSHGGLVKDGTDQSFVEDVIEPSKEVPVLVDFWAPWCGPCRQLTPAIERAVNAANGAVKLVKVNIDENPGVAGQLRIQSIPAVIAFKDGQPLDGFMGALPESQINEFINRISGQVSGEDVDALIERAENRRLAPGIWAARRRTSPPRCKWTRNAPKRSPAWRAFTWPAAIRLKPRRSWTARRRPKNPTRPSPRSARAWSWPARWKAPRSRRRRSAGGQGRQRPRNSVRAGPRAAWRAAIWAGRREP
jgi:thioredoxin